MTAIDPMDVRKLPVDLVVAMLKKRQENPGAEAMQLLVRDAAHSDQILADPSGGLEFERSADPGTPPFAPARPARGRRGRSASMRAGCRTSGS